MWKDILLQSVQSSSLVVIFLDNCKVKVGNGHRIKFWKDNWCENLSLKYAFPLLYRVVVDTSVTLSDMMIRKEEAGEWSFQFRRALFDWERVELSRLVSQIEAGPNLRCCSEDTLVWKASESGSFSVQSMYKLLVEGTSNSSIASKRIWVKHVPPRVQFFGWVAWQRKTKDGCVYAQDWCSA